MRFWRQEFTKSIDLERFEKTYAYNIRHNYGREGSMVNYTPYSCMKVISQSVGPQESHGCPFKQLDAVQLKQKLTDYGVGKAHVQEIAAYAGKGHFQLACGKYFELAHSTKQEIAVTHPNQYFEMSQQLIKERTGGDANATVNGAAASQTVTTPSTQKAMGRGGINNNNNTPQRNVGGLRGMTPTNKQNASAGVRIGKVEDSIKVDQAALTQSFLDAEEDDDEMNSTLFALADSQAA